MRISDWSSDVCSPDLPRRAFFMNLQQFRFVRETIRRNFNLTEAARALFTSQPGVSKAIIEFEDELGVKIFERHGKRSEERRVGKTCVSTGRSRWSPDL